MLPISHHTDYPINLSTYFTVISIPTENISFASEMLHIPLTLQEIEEKSKSSSNSKIIVEEFAPQQYKLLFGISSLITAFTTKEKQIPAIVLPPQHSHILGPIFIDKHFHWEELDDIECAEAYQWLLDHYNCTTEMLAKIRNTSRPVISNYIRLLHLPDSIQTLLRSKKLQKSHCFELLRLSEKEDQLFWANEIVAKKLNVRAVKESITKQLPKKENSLHIQLTQATEETGTITISYNSIKEKNILLAYIKRYRAKD